MDLGVSGLASGFDWKTLVEKLADAERLPQKRLRVEQGDIADRNAAYSSLKTQLGVLQSRVTDLKDPTLYSSRTTATGDSTIATATAEAGAATGHYVFSFTQLASAAVRQGASVAKPLSDTDDVSGVVLSGAGFPTAPTAGTFTVNGKQVTLATSDTLQQVFDKISTATGSTVTATYSASTDKITLSSSGEIVLGSATDTSNFLQLAKLNNNGGGSVVSSDTLGGPRMTDVAGTTKLATMITDGGSGAGEFKVNGVSIQFSATKDSVQNIMDRINASSAGVTASYDAVNNRFELTNKTTGDMGIALEDVTGNFLAATGLSSGTLNHGKNLLYTINGGGQLVSQSNTITQASSGLSGLSITALQEGESTSVTVGSDTEKVKSALSAFLTEYNKLQSMIDTQTASTTDSTGKVTAGTLAADGDANDLATQLRQVVYAQISGLSGTLNHVDNLGIKSNGDDNTLEMDDSTKLDDALANRLSSVQDLFANTTNGLAVRLDSFINKTIGDSGTLIARQTTLTKQSTDIDAQVVDMERLVQSHSDRLTASFVAMETAQAKINQQLSYLTKTFG